MTQVDLKPDDLILGRKLVPSADSWGSNSKRIPIIHHLLTNLEVIDLVL